MHAVPFGLGPATTALAIVNRIRAVLDKDKLEIVGLCKEPASYVFGASAAFDVVLQFRLSDFVKEPGAWLSMMEGSDALLLVGDFLFARHLSHHSILPFFVDVISWLQMEHQLDHSKCRHVFVMRGLDGGRVVHVDQRPANVTFVEPIWDEAIANLPNRAKEGESRTLLVNFGGILNPLGDPWPTVNAMVPLILESAAHSSQFAEIEICGGDPRLMGYTRTSGGEFVVRCGTLAHEQFLRRLACSRTILTVAGLSVVCESLAVSKTPYFVLPLNYSHLLQGKMVSTLLQLDQEISSFGIEDYDSLPISLSDEIGSQAVVELGRRFSRDASAQAAFRRRIDTILSRASGPAASGECWRPTGNGAGTVATCILNELL